MEWPGEIICLTLSTIPLSLALVSHCSLCPAREERGLSPVPQSRSPSFAHSSPADAPTIRLSLSFVCRGFKRCF